MINHSVLRISTAYTYNTPDLNTCFAFRWIMDYPSTESGSLIHGVTASETLTRGYSFLLKRTLRLIRIVVCQQSIVFYSGIVIIEQSASLRWFHHDLNDPSAECYHPRPIRTVQRLRGTSAWTLSVDQEQRDRQDRPPDQCPRPPRPR
jgi:hypothetical protein